MDGAMGEAEKDTIKEELMAWVRALDDAAMLNLLQSIKQARH